jgi:hypothetical protein
MKNATVTLYAVWLLHASSALAQIPSCTPPVASTIAISYHGATSGCSEAAGSPPCIVGENVQFFLASGANVGNCLIVYIWSFPEGPVTGQPPQNQQFQNPGTYTVTLTMTNDSPPFTLMVTQPVRVAAAASIPALSPTVIALLLLSMTLIGVQRLKA